MFCPTKGTTCVANVVVIAATVEASSATFGSQNEPAVWPTETG